MQYYIHYSLPARAAGLAAGALLALLSLPPAASRPDGGMHEHTATAAAGRPAHNQSPHSSRQGGHSAAPLNTTKHSMALLGGHPVAPVLSAGQMFGQLNAPVQTCSGRRML